MKRLPLLAAAALATVSLSACAADGTPTDLDNGTVYQVTTPSGLNCDVFDTNKAGGVACDFGSYAPPASWDTKTGSLETEPAADGEIEVSRFTDGHLCVTFDGNESGGITCHYPTR